MGAGKMEKVRIGVIGCGIGKWHLEGYAADPRVEVVALAGLDTDRCQSIASEFGVPNVYERYEDLLRRDDINGVSVAVPNWLHMSVTMAALASGRHVLVEKPLALNAAEGEQMVQAANAAGLILGIAFNRRARADMEVLKAEIDAGNLGEIYQATAFWRRRSGIPGLGSWFTSKALAGGGPLIDLGVHVLDMALWLMGDPEIERVSGATYAKIGPQGKGNWSGSRFSVSKEQPYEVEDLAVAFLRAAGGATIFLEAGWAAYTSATDEFGVYLLGDKGGAELHVKDYAATGTLQIFGDINGVPVDCTPRLQPKPPAAGHIAITHRFVDSILTGVPMSPNGVDGLQRTRLIDAIYRSAALGREVAVSE